MNIADLTPEDLADLQRAIHLLEQPGLAIRIANRIGKPLEGLIKFLPQNSSALVQEAVRRALDKALDVAVNSLGPSRGALEGFHKALAGASGGIGGVFGLPALAVELPVSTTIMLRSIAEIAREEGENMETAEGRLACLEVFALGGSSSSDDSAEAAYFAVRAALAQAIREAAEHIATRGAAGKGAPIMVRLLTQIASRFGIVISEKTALQAAPIIGAAGGAAINVVFMDHFQNMARGHFIVRRLERKYGEGNVRACYLQLSGA
jgi:hypothetical protein